MIGWMEDQKETDNLSHTAFHLQQSSEPMDDENCGIVIGWMVDQEKTANLSHPALHLQQSSEL